MKDVINVMNIYLKGFTEKFYMTSTVAHLQPVLETIRRAREMGIWVEITTLIIPGENDSDEELTNIATFIHSIDPTIPWHISAFHPDYLMDTTPRTPLSTLQRAYSIGTKIGLHYIYCGNVVDPERETTYCKKCKAPLMTRGRFKTKFSANWGQGNCKKCGTKCDGEWK